MSGQSPNPVFLANQKIPSELNFTFNYIIFLTKYTNFVSSDEIIFNEIIFFFRNMDSKKIVNFSHKLGIR